MLYVNEGAVYLEASMKFFWYCYALIVFSTVMFMKRCTLSEDVNGSWNQVALGDLQVYYDPDLYAARICINNDSGEVVSNTLIGVNTVMNVSFKNKKVLWFTKLFIA